MEKRDKVEKDLCLLLQGVESDNNNEYCHTLKDLIKTNNILETSGISHDIEEYRMNEVFEIINDESNIGADFGINILYGCFALTNWRYLKDGSCFKIGESSMSDFIGILYNNRVLIILHSKKNCNLLKKFCEKWAKK